MLGRTARLDPAQRQAPRPDLWSKGQELAWRKPDWDLGRHPTQGGWDRGLVLCGVAHCRCDYLGHWGRFGGLRLRAATSPPSSGWWSSPVAGGRPPSEEQMTSALVPSSFCPLSTYGVLPGSLWSWGQAVWRLPCPCSPPSARRHPSRPGGGWHKLLS